MGFNRIVFAGLLLASILVVSTQVKARDLAETTNIMKISLLQLPRIPTSFGSIVCCSQFNCTSDCFCCYRAVGEAVDAYLQAETKQ